MLKLKISEIELPENSAEHYNIASYFLNSHTHAHSKNKLRKNSFKKAQLGNCGSKLCATVSWRVIHMLKVKVHI